MAAAMEMELLAHKGLRDHKVFRAQLALLDRRVKQEPPVLPELKALPALLVPSVSPALPELKALPALLGLLVQPAQRVLVALLVPLDL